MKINIDVFPAKICIMVAHNVIKKDTAFNAIAIIFYKKILHYAQIVRKNFVIYAIQKYFWIYIILIFIINKMN